MTLGILFLELTILYFLSRSVTQALFRLFMLLFRSRPTAVSLMLALQFPGTVIHELSHLFTAEILGVKTGKMKLEPESIRGDSITSGSVMIAESDPFRRYAIGLAPLAWGIITLTAISYFIPTLYESVFLSNTPLFENTDTIWLFFAGYALYAVSNTMFPSPADTHGIFPFLLTITLLGVMGYAIGLQPSIPGPLLETVARLLTTLAKSLGAVIGLNSILLVLTLFLSGGVSRLLHIRVN